MSLFSLLAGSGCRHWTQSTPRQVNETDHRANFERVFRQDLPSDITVVNSVLVTYRPRIGVVTTDDFEFELIAPSTWLPELVRRFHLRHQDDDFFKEDHFTLRNKNARPWYAPGPLDAYERYRDITSVGYVHLLVAKAPEPDGRRRLFVSKH